MTSAFRAMLVTTASAFRTMAAIMTPALGAIHAAASAVAMALTRMLCWPSSTAMVGVMLLIAALQAP